MQITPLSNYPALVQDWFTNLAWDQPQLFYILPCVYNAQTNIQLLRPPWEEVGSSTIIAYNSSVNGTSQFHNSLRRLLLGSPNAFIMHYLRAL